MSIDREFSNWEKTATLCHVIYQMHRDPKRSREISALDFNPWSDESDREATLATDELTWDEMGVLFRKHTK